jgi:hypothetical protein
MAQQHDAEYARPIDITPEPGAQDESSADAGWDRGTGDAVSRPAPRRSSPVRRIALGALVAVGLAGAAVLGIAGARILEQKDAVLQPPDSVSSLTRDRSAGAVETADNLSTALEAGIDLDDSVAVVYADGSSTDRSVFLFGGTALLFSPGRDLDEVLLLLGEQGEGASGMREVPAGDLGGVMKCGMVNVPDGSMSACGWADHGSIAVAMFPGREVAEAASLMRELRDATQTRS